MEKYLYIASFSWVVFLGMVWVNSQKTHNVRCMDNTAEFLLWKNSDEKPRLQSQEHCGNMKRACIKSELAYFNLGIIYAEVGEWGKAETAYKKHWSETRVLASRNEFTEDEGYSLMNRG